MNAPTILKLNDLIQYLDDGIRVNIFCKFRGMKDYQKFAGTEASTLHPDILNSLCIVKIAPGLDIFKDGIISCLNIYASDNVARVSFNPVAIAQMMGNASSGENNNPEDEADEKSENGENDE